MSAAVEKSECASCGIAEGDNIVLKKCACHLVKYCSVKCQKDHWPQHKKECKKRAAELRDELLFKQPESTHLGDCPICCVPLPIDINKSIMGSCCGKRICNGCNIANQMREREARLQRKCPFCRSAHPKSIPEMVERMMKRVEANDPLAMCEMGLKSFMGGDYKSAFEYYSKAATLGDAEAHFQLSALYQYGRGVEKDKKRAWHHLKEAAIAGHPEARHNLGKVEAENGQSDRAAKHFIIAANLGFDDSLKSVKDLYKDGCVSKEEFSAALRGHKAAVDATKSPQREQVEAVAQRDRMLRILKGSI